MMSCRKATRLMSDAKDRPLQFSEKLSLNFHKMMCSGCRRFDQQLGVLTGLARQYAKGEGPTAPIDSEDYDSCK